MKRLIGILLILMTFSCAWAKDSHLLANGAVFGIWPAGSNVVIDGPTFVPRDKSLVIEPGVHLLIKTTSPFIVYGSFEANGTESDPILITPDEDWRGFDFEGPDRVCTLNWVNMTSNGGMAAIAVSATDVQFNMAHCDLRAKYFALRADGCLLHADNNALLTVAVHSHTVEFTNLQSNVDRDCENATGNYFRANRVRAMVPYDTVPPSYQMTAGMRIIGSTNLCLLGNTISVQAPGEIVGAHFEPGLSGGPEMMFFQDCNITVHGLRGAPRGIIQANGGRLWVIHCVVDVLDEMEGSRYIPIGIMATLNANVIVNSSIVQLEQGGLFFHVPNNGSITLQYMDWWVTGQSVMDYSEPNQLHGSPAWDFPWDVQGVIVESHVINANPHFRYEGAWGTWTSLAQVQAYYSTLWGSPCIDAGDSAYGWDPDGTLPDIGHYYYDQTASASNDRPVLPVDFSVDAPYPNPFNSTVIIPLSIQRSGRIDVTVYDVLGREVAQLISGTKAAGEYRIPYSATEISSGMYFVSVRYNGQRAGIKPILLIR